MFEQILVPLDGSGQAENVLPFVRALCLGPSSSAVLVRIVDDEKSLPYARLYLQRIGDALRSEGIKTKAIARAGPVIETLYTIAVEENISLIAASTHGGETPIAAPLGQYSRQFLASSPVPIVAVPPSARGEPADARKIAFRTLLVVVDESGPMDALISVASDFAVAHDSEVVLLIASPPALTGRAEAEIQVEAERELGHWYGILERHRIPTDPVIEIGDPADAVLRIAQERGADLIVMSEAVASVLEKAGVPLLVTPSGSTQPRGGMRRAVTGSAPP